MRDNEKGAFTLKTSTLVGALAALALIVFSHPLALSMGNEEEAGGARPADATEQAASRADARSEEGTPAETSPPDSTRFERVFRGTLTRSAEMRYLLYLPPAYREMKKPWPLMLYLHGGLGRGDDFSKLSWYPVVRMLNDGGNALPFIVVVPQCPAGGMWDDTETLTALLDEVSSEYAVDSTRVYLVGYSMGGLGAWYLAYRHPERFAAVAPMSGYSIPWWATRLKTVPIWAFHGAKDDRVPASVTERMVEQLRREGGNVRLSLNPERGHSPPSDAEHLELFNWLLEQRRTPGGP